MRVLLARYGVFSMFLQNIFLLPFDTNSMGEKNTATAQHNKQYRSVDGRKLAYHTNLRYINIHLAVPGVSQLYFLTVSSYPEIGER